MLEVIVVLALPGLMLGIAAPSFLLPPTRLEDAASAGSAAFVAARGQGSPVRPPLVSWNLPYGGAIDANRERLTAG
jgi:hypothetical protein